MQENSPFSIQVFSLTIDLFGTKIAARLHHFASLGYHFIPLFKAF